jgi:heme exporter protein D
MLDLGRHGEFVWLSYGFTAIVVILVIVWLLYDGRRYRRQLALLEAQGRGRRSQPPAAGNPDSSAKLSRVERTPKES